MLLNEFIRSFEGKPICQEKVPLKNMEEYGIPWNMVESFGTNQAPFYPQVSVMGVCGINSSAKGASSSASATLPGRRRGQPVTHQAGADERPEKLRWKRRKRSVMGV